jgi:DNA-binding HxlR family transcriptional regulator
MLRLIDPRRCPVEQALEIISSKWKPMILWRLARGPLRHAELRRALPGTSQRMLTLHLRELERDGLVSRTVFAENPPRVEYALSTPARSLLPVMEAMGRWLLESHAELQAHAACASWWQEAAANGSQGNVRRFRAPG